VIPGINPTAGVDFRFSLAHPVSVKALTPLHAIAVVAFLADSE